MYAPIHARTRSSYLFHGTSVDMRRRRYDDGDGRGVEETKIGPRLLERAGYQK
jgi:hypothetical protein